MQKVLSLILLISLIALASARRAQRAEFIDDDEHWCWNGRCYRDDDLAEDDDLFLNWDKVNLGCTIKCGVYWKCVYENFRDSSAQISCQQPAGCECNKFADDDEKINWKKIGKTVKKGVDAYKKYKEIRDVIRSDDDERLNLKKAFKKINWKKIDEKINKGIDVYNKAKEIRDVIRSDDDEFLNWGNVNLGCTINCGVYWKCVYENFRDPAAQISCQQPAGCECNKFADDDDEKINWKKIGKTVKKGIDAYKKYKEIRDVIRSDDDEFLNWDKVNLGCTIKCGVYWKCVYENFRDSSAQISCQQPAGCECNKFADDDEKINWKKIGKTVKKGVDAYKKYKEIRDVIRSDDDEFFNWGNVNLGCTINCGVYWKCVYENFRNPAGQISCQQPAGCECNKFADDDDEKINWKKIGKTVKKGVDAYKKYKEIRDVIRSDDDEFLNWDKVNLGCTIKCGVYWKCVYENFRDSSAQISCQQPAGCECNKFADDDEIPEFKVGAWCATGACKAN